MKTKSKVLISALLVIALCVSLIAGTTFALFSSEDRVNVTVSSGKVEVKASIADNSVQTVQLNKEYAVGLNNVSEDASVAVDGNKVSLINAVAGDGVKFVVNVVNNSTVTVQYRTKIVIEGKGASQLTVNVDGKKLSSNQTSLWQTLAVPANDSAKNVGQVAIEVLIPSEATGSEAIDCSVQYVVEAIQGNAKTVNEEAEAYGAEVAKNIAENSEITLTGDAIYNDAYILSHPIDMNTATDEEKKEYFSAYMYTTYPDDAEILLSDIEIEFNEEYNGDWNEVFDGWGVYSSNPLCVSERKTIDLDGNSLMFNYNLSVDEGGDLTIKGGELVIDYAHSSSLISVAKGATLTLENVTIDLSSDKSISSLGNLILKNCNISGSNDPLLSVSGVTTIEKCTFNNLTGNAIQQNGGEMTIRDSSITGTLSMYGRPNVSIWKFSGTMSIYNSTLIANPNGMFDISNAPKKAVYDENGAVNYYNNNDELVNEQNQRIDEQGNPITK